MLIAFSFGFPPIPVISIASPFLHGLNVMYLICDNTPLTIRAARHSTRNLPAQHEGHEVSGFEDRVNVVVAGTVAERAS